MALLSFLYIYYSSRDLCTVGIFMLAKGVYFITGLAHGPPASGFSRRASSEPAIGDVDLSFLVRIPVIPGYFSRREAAHAL